MTTSRKIWQVWREPADTHNQPGELVQNDEILFTSTQSQARGYYDARGGHKAGLHIGYTTKRKEDSQ